jgi:hypothetical protein
MHPTILRLLRISIPSLILAAATFKFVQGLREGIVEVRNSQYLVSESPGAYYGILAVYVLLVGLGVLMFWEAWHNKKT